MSERDLYNSVYQFIINSCTPDEWSKAQIESILPDVSSKYIPDIYLPIGCESLGFPNKTIIEIKILLKSDTLFRVKNWSQNLINTGYNVILIYIYKNDFSSELLSKFSDESGPFKVFSFHELKEKHTANITQKTIDFPSNIDKARKIFLRGPNTLFLGAGVSMSAGLPSWKNLLSDLLEKADRKFNKDHYDEVFEECGYSSIVFGRLIQTAFGKKGFHKEIRDIIYKNKEHSSLITTICDIIKSNRLIVNGVITYNYDDLIEQELSKIGVKNYSIYENNEPDVVFPIYHVHGLLTQEAPIDSTIVLSEKEYHERYKRSFHWSNIEQLHALQRTNCFFIGLSMTDPNLRRLLEVSRDEKGESVPPLRHFAFINKNDVGNKLYEDERNKFIDIYEKMLEQLGVGVIWYNDYENLPYELLKLSQADKK